MNSTNQSEKSVSNGVHLLISLLIRYPEIGTVTFDPDHHTLKLSFMFHNLPEQEDFAALEQSLLQSLHTYYRLERFRQPLVNLSVKTVASLITLTLVRDIYSFGKGEIDLVVAFLRQELGQALIVEANQPLVEEDLRFQEELIENMLISVKKEEVGHKLFGIREEGKVMVFNK